MLFIRGVREKLGEREEVGEKSRGTLGSMEGKNAAAAFLQTTVYIKANKSLCFRCPGGCMKVVVSDDVPSCTCAEVITRTRGCCSSGRDEVVQKLTRLSSEDDCVFHKRQNNHTQNHAQKEVHQQNGAFS